MSDTFDHEDEAWSDAFSRDDCLADGTYGFRPRSRHPLLPPKRVHKCVHCGSTDVKWRELDEGWRLFNTVRSIPGNRKTPHNCRHVPATADDFNNV